MKHTVVAWNSRRILVAVVECKVVRPAVVLPVEAVAALNELRAQLGHRKGDSRWNHWNGALEVGVCPNTTVARRGTP